MREGLRNGDIHFVRKLGTPRSPLVRAEIARLDADRDCERIAYLLVAYEFPFDMQRAMEIALFHTFGSKSVAKRLDRTGELSSRGQKRYDDTRLLIAHLLETGWSSDEGARALAQMNHIHGHFKIPNDDFLFVLWTFIDFPIQWLQHYGYRPMTDHECQAWFNFWRELGSRMGITDIPHDKPALDAFVAAYEAREMEPNPASTHIARATLDVMKAWLPWPLSLMVVPVTLSLVRPQLLSTLDLGTPSPWFQALVHHALRLRGVTKRHVSFEQYPSTLSTSLNRTYPGNAYTIEALGPEYAHDKARPRTKPMGAAQQPPTPTR